MIERIRQLFDMSPRSYMVALASNYAVMVFTALVQLILVPIYMRTIGTEGFGTVTMIVSLVHTVSVGLIWISGSSARIMAEHAAHDEWKDTSAVYSLSETIYLLYGIIVGILFLISVEVADGKLFLFPEDMAFDDIWIMSISIALFIILQFDLNFQVQAYQAAKYHWIGNLLLVFNALLFLFLTTSMLLFSGKLYWVFIAMALSALFTRLACMYGWRYVRNEGVNIHFTFPSRTSIPLFQRLLGPMGVKYAIYGLLARIGQMDTLLIGWLGGTHAAGLFALLMKIPYLCIQVIWRMAATAEPYFIHYDARGEETRLVENYRKGQLITAVVSLILGTLFALFGRWVLALWVGETNIPESDEAYWLAGMVIVWIGATRWPTRCAYALLKLRSLSIVTFFESVVKVVLIVLLFDSADYLAPLWAINIEYIFGVLVLYIWLGRQLATRL